MAIRFDTLEDKQKYTEAVSVLHRVLPTLAEDVTDMFVRADETVDLDYAETLINRAVDILYGAFLTVDRFTSIHKWPVQVKPDGSIEVVDLRQILLDAHSALVWCEVID